jgi:hypothetical protein
MLRRRWARWRRIPSLSTIRRRRGLHLDTILLTIVSLVRASTCRSTIVPIIAVVLGVVTRARGPASAVEGLATGLAATAGG